MPKVLSYEADVLGGLTARKKLVIPALASDPGTPVDGYVWVNTTDHVFRYRENGVTKTVGTTDNINEEMVRDVVGATLVAGQNIDITVNDAADQITISVEDLTSADIGDFQTAVQSVTVDATTLNGLSASDIESAVTSAIVDSAPGTLDTLRELADALADDPNFATTVTNNLATKVNAYEATLTGGALTEVVTHGLGTRNVQVSCYEGSGVYQEVDYIVRHTSTTTVTIVSEGANIPAGLVVVVHGRP